MSAHVEPVKLLIAAMGGEGGSVLADWIVGAARRHGLPVQATSIPGVAQRTGATTYYIEILPTRIAALKGREPVLDLYPGVGAIDVMVASELVETARAIERGFVDPERTTLIASTHRVFALAEKMDMADGTYDSAKILKAAPAMARRAVLFDMARAARDAGSRLNAVALGAIAGAEVLPLPREIFIDGIRAAGKSVESNLAGFAAGVAYAQGDVVEARPGGGIQTSTTAPSLSPAAAALRERITGDYTGGARETVLEGAGRLLDYQDARYATLYLDRLDMVRAVDGAGRDDALIRETARHLALRMSFEDIFRVAQLKTRRSRLARVRAEVGARPGQPVAVSEFLKPGPVELASALPSFIARPLIAWAERRPDQGRGLHVGLRLRTDTITGFALLRLTAAQRRLRRLGHRYKVEQGMIEDWLDLVRRAAARDRALALEIVECARLIKGYGDTYRRGTDNFARIAAHIIEPALAGKPAPAQAGKPTKSAAALRRAREAALADPDGKALDAAL